MAVSKRLRYEILRRDQHTCRYCGATAPDVKVTIDHVLPVALGGTDTPDNLVTACEPCNSGKTSTAPDAPVVANVAEDALRWAGAMARAAQEALESTQNRDKLNKAFMAAWKKHGGVQSDLPDNWRGSLKSLIVAGLPAEEIAECVGIAFDQKHVYDRNRFKYTCGVAWRKVDGLRKRAGEIVGMQRAPEAKKQETEDEGDEFTPATVLEACRDLLENNFEEEQREEYLDHVRAEEEPGYPEVSLYYFAVSHALSELSTDCWQLEHTIQRHMSLYSQEAVDWAMNASRDKHREYLGSDFTEASVLTQALNFLTEPLHAAKTLKSLPEDERQKWVNAARSELGDDAHERQIAVYAIQLRQDANRPDFTGEPPF